jgi:hypothetical protein
MAGSSLVFLLVFAFMLAFGCTALERAGIGGNGNGNEGAPAVYGQPTPAGSPNTPTAQVERTGTGVTPNASGAGGEGEKSNTTCTITLNPPAIYAGGSTEVRYSVYTAENTVFTFNCGNQIKEISTGGLISGAQMCQFNSPGDQIVRIKDGGRTCAQATLSVMERGAAAPEQQKICQIDESSVKRDFAAYHYEARVDFSGFSPNDELKWVCDYTVTRKKLGSDPVMGMPLYYDIYCDFSKTPYKDSIDVSIGNVSCGSISTR